MTRLSLSCLGSFQVTLAGEPITSFRSSKVQGLLVYLALTSPIVHEREVLAEFLWPDEPESVAKKNLRQSLYQLRQLVEEPESDRAPHLLVTRTTSQFNPASDHGLDVADFMAFLESEQFDRALAVYQGELLPGFGCDSLPFEDWLRRERERLHLQAMRALEELAEKGLAAANYREAIEWARRQLALEPWREEAHRQLIQALALLGERSAALAQYETCRAILDEELGVEPSAETKALMARVRRQNASQRHQPVPDLLAQGRKLELAFVGRASEHGTLVRAYERARAEGPQVVALIGEAGIGKTRLADQFIMWASAQGADVLRGRAFQTGSGLSYQPLTQALRQRMDHVNAPEDLLSDVWLTEMTRILPELKDRYPDLPDYAQGEGDGRQHLFEAMTRFCQSLADRSPVVFFVDDWHWADAASLDALHYATMGWSEARAPILVLLTLRQEQLTEKLELRTWLSRLQHDASCYQLHLGTLTEEEIEELVRALLPVDQDDLDTRSTDGVEAGSLHEFGQWLFKQTDGQPFFLMEVLSILAEEGLLRPDLASGAWKADWRALNQRLHGAEAGISPGVQQRIDAWISRVSEPAGGLLAATAVLGEQATFPRLCQVAGLEEGPALDSLDELTSRQLLRETVLSLNTAKEVVYAFTHQMISDVVYAETGAARKLILHRRAFEALKSEASTKGNVPASALAHQAFNAGLWGETIEYAIAAGDEAMRLLAVRVAIPHYERARLLVDQSGWPESLRAVERRKLYMGLGRAYELDEAWEDALNVYLVLVAKARKVGEPTMECEGLNRLATVHINSQREPERAVPLLEEARAIAEKCGDQRGMAETEWNLSMVARMEDDPERARLHGEAALTIARQLQDPQLVARCLNSLAYVYARMRRWDSVGRYADEARDLYAIADNRILEADSGRVVGWSQLLSGRACQSALVLRDSFAFSQDIGNLWGEAESAWRLAWALLESGNLGEAIKVAKQGADYARQVGQPTMVEMALSTLGTVQRNIMALEAARESLTEVVKEARGRGTSGYVDWAMGELCAVCALDNAWGPANAFAKQAVQIRQAHGLPPVGLTGWYEIEALIRSDDALARTEVERLESLGERNPRERLAWLRCRAVLARWDKDDDGAIAHLQAASELAKEIGIPAERWSILGELGKIYQHQGNGEEAQKAFWSAAETIAELADTIDDEESRHSFLDAAAIRSILGSNRTE